MICELKLLNRGVVKLLLGESREAIEDVNLKIDSPIGLLWIFGGTGSFV